MIKFWKLFSLVFITTLLGCASENDHSEFDKSVNEILKMSNEQGSENELFFKNLSHLNDLEKQGLNGPVSELIDSTKLKTSHYLFSEDGMITSEIITYPDGSTYHANENTRVEYLYEEEGGIYRVNTYYTDELAHYELYSYEYGTSKRYQIVRRYDIKDNLLSTTKITHNEDYQVIEMNSKDILGVETQTEFIYSVDKKLLKQIETDKPTGQVLQTVDYTTAYDSLGNWLKSESVAFGDTTINWRTIHFYP